MLIVLVSVQFSSCTEEPEPEALLPPRNFNPHPYQAGYDPQASFNGNTGPVLFPETPETAPGNGDDYNNGIINAIDTHPYANVAKKKKYKQAGRWSFQVKIVLGFC